MKCRPIRVQGSWLAVAWRGTWRHWGTRGGARGHLFGWVWTRRAWCSEVVGRVREKERGLDKNTEMDKKGDRGEECDGAQNAGGTGQREGGGIGIGFIAGTRRGWPCPSSRGRERVTGDQSDR